MVKQYGDINREFIQIDASYSDFEKDIDLFLEEERLREKLFIHENSRIYKIIAKLVEICNRVRRSYS